MPPFSSHAFDWRKFSKMEVQYERIITKAYSLKVILGLYSGDRHVVTKLQVENGKCYRLV